MRGFEEYILLMNMQEQAANVALFYMGNKGYLKRIIVSVPLLARRTVYVNDINPNSEVSTKEISDSGIIAERSMYFNYEGKDGGHDSIGATEPSTTWSLAEGYTGGDFDEYILVQNPNPDKASIKVTLMKKEGSPVVRTYNVSANARYTIHVDDILPNDEVSAMIQSETGIVAERSMYFNYYGYDDGHNSIGYAQ